MMWEVINGNQNAPNIKSSARLILKFVYAYASSCVSLYVCKRVHKWITFQVEAHSQGAVIWRWKKQLISGHYRQSALRRTQSHSSLTLPMGVQAQWDEKIMSSEGGLKHTVSHSLRYKDWHARTSYRGKQGMYKDVNQK